LAWTIDAVVVWGPLGVVVEVATRNRSNAEGLVIGAVIVMSALALLPAYYAILHARNNGQTVGKMAVGISVRDKRSLRTIGLGRALLRAYFTAFLWLLAYVPAVVDALWAFFTRDRQTIHDLVARTIVIKVRRPSRVRPQIATVKSR